MDKEQFMTHMRIYFAEGSSEWGYIDIHGEDVKEYFESIYDLIQERFVKNG